MTYSPAQAGVMDGTDFFTSIGLIGGSTGMAPLPCSMPTAMVAPYGYRDTITPTVTGSVLKGLSGAGNEYRNMGWNLDGGDGSTSYTKALGIAYLVANGGVMCHIGFSNDALASGANASDIDNNYSGGVRHYAGAGATIWARDGSDSVVGADTTILTFQTASSPVTGVAFYVEDDVQKLYLKKGSGSQWILVLSTTDTTFSGTPFKSFGYIYAAYSSGKTCRMITPVMVWGA